MVSPDEMIATLEELTGVLHEQAREMERLIAHVEGTTVRLGYESQMSVVASTLTGLHVRLRKMREQRPTVWEGFEQSMRDWLAGQALQGLLAGPNAPKKSATESPDQFAVRVAEEAYLFADAVLKARQEPPAS